MPRPVFKDGTVAKGALAVGQTLRLGGFLMTACSATAPTMTSQVIKSDLHVNSEFAEQLDPMELSSVNKLLDRIAALGVATDYDQIGLKPDLREINSPQITHHVVVVEEQYGDHRDLHSFPTRRSSDLDNIEELSMKAPMSASKPADLG